jgi:hypothetical protein
MSAVVFNTAPVHISGALEEYGALLNTACAGTTNQHILSNVQVNIAPAESLDSG